MNETADVVVVGGGIAGLTIAWELARRGVGVTLLEQERIGAGASGRNTGTLLHQVEPEVAALLAESEAVYAELLDGPVDFGWTEYPELLLARDEAQLALANAKGRAIAAQGIRVEFVDGAAIGAELPALGGVAGGVLLHGAHRVDAERTVLALAEAARRAGAKLRTGVRVGALADGGVWTAEGFIAARAVVLATGPWLADLHPRIEVRGGRGWLMRTTALPFALPWIVEEVSWPDQAVLGRAAEPVLLNELASGAASVPVGECALLCPLPDGSGLVGASLSTSLRDAVEGVDAPQRVARRVLEVAPGLQARIVRAWWGLRPMTPDGLPVAGLWDDGVHVHGGHGSLGMQAAPATAAWLAAAMHGEPTPASFDDLRPGRFA
jgi:glycine/D-amino acid oxidase-like deaminating enzyme